MVNVKMLTVAPFPEYSGTENLWQLYVFIRKISFTASPVETKAEGRVTPSGPKVVSLAAFSQFFLMPSL